MFDRGGPLRRVGEIIGDFRLPSSEMGSISGLGEPEYVCTICKDAHFVYPLDDAGKPNYQTVVPCVCVMASLEERKRQRIRQHCELPPKSKGMTFDSFEMAPGLEEALEAAYAIATEPQERPNWLTLSSDTNRGKTHLLVAICRHWLQEGRLARYAYVPLLLEELRRGFRQEGDYSYEARFDLLQNVPLLALDDLGVESRSPWVNEKLDTIIDARLMKDLALVVTTNTPMNQLPFRIRSRLQRNGKVVIIDAPEYEFGGKA